MTLPLQVFEDRYKSLINDCLQTEQPFGVIFIKSGNEVGDKIPQIHKIGTVAKIKKMITDQNSLILLETIGVQRFEILEIINNDPYLTAEVKLLESIDNDTDILFEEMKNELDEFLTFSEIANGGFTKSHKLPKYPGDLADKIAARSITFWNKTNLQKILELLDTTNRLKETKPIMKSLLQFAKQEANEKIKRMKSRSIYLN
jgi:Lon protease-like protein